MHYFISEYQNNNNLGVESKKILIAFFNILRDVFIIFKNKKRWVSK